MGRRGFTIIEVLVIVVVAVLTVGILLPMLGVRRCGNTRVMQNQLQIRGIHSGLVLFAQNNNMYYPGFDSRGEPGEPIDGHDPLSVEARFIQLLEDNYFSGEYIISPHETKSEYEVENELPLTSDNYSFALLALIGDGERVSEWRETMTGEAPIVSDRAIVRSDGIVSVQSRKSMTYSGWHGAVGFNDNHVENVAALMLPTKMGSAAIEDDNLFEAATDDDAAMAFEGVDKFFDRSVFPTDDEQGD